MSLTWSLIAQQGPSENKASVYIPVIDACSELPALAEKIASELKSQAAAAAASATSAPPAKTTPEQEVNLVVLLDHLKRKEQWIMKRLSLKETKRKKQF